MCKRQVATQATSFVASKFKTYASCAQQMMVWAPGGYKFSDFTKAGLGIKVIHTVMCVLLAAQFWKFEEKINWTGVKV